MPVVAPNDRLGRCVLLFGCLSPFTLLAVASVTIGGGLGYLTADTYNS